MKKYDLVVVGGGTAGCAAAYIAGKLGLKTLLLEKNIHLGGTISSALVVPAMNSGENLINTDFYNDLILEMKAIRGQITYQNNPGWLNPELLKIVLDKMLCKVNVDVIFGAEVYKIDLENRYIKHIYISNKILSTPNYALYKSNKTLFEPISARYVIDSTGNCEIAKLCNCEFLNKKNETQPFSLRFIMSGINIDEFSNWLLQFDKDRSVTTVEYIDGVTHLSTAYTWDKGKNWALKPLFDDAVSKGVLQDTDRNYFQIFTIAGMPDSIAFNCPRISIDIDYTDNFAVSNAILGARSAIFRISEFCKIYFPGFKNAYISNIADQLGVRVSNRIKGKYIYTVEDLKSGKSFDTPVLRSNYPIDVHSSKKDSSTLYDVGYYEVPIEALMSFDIDNLFVAGRSLSADFMAQGALRIQPSCFSMGEGAAKFIAKLIRQS